MKNRADAFRARADRKLKLNKLPTLAAPYYASESGYRARLEKGVEELDALQNLLYASDRHSLLLVFQAMDAGGKDSTIRHVLSGINPQGVRVHSFKQPSQEELRHDFLWRAQCRLPERGMIGVFNRSHYEEVVVTRVHPDLLRNEGIPEAPDKAFWKARYRSIRDAEAHWHRSGIRVLKFFLHISREEQRKRLLARLDDPEKIWKFSAGDLEERELWDRYMNAYEDAISATTTGDSPWHIIPADDKPNARLIVSGIIIAALRGLDLEYPRLDKDKVAELGRLRKLLEKEKGKGKKKA
jgi:PPK2 family polyphosphate:nucleotide phosphotransferase